MSSEIQPLPILSTHEAQALLEKLWHSKEVNRVKWLQNGGLKRKADSEAREKHNQQSRKSYRKKLAEDPSYREHLREQNRKYRERRKSKQVLDAISGSQSESDN